MNNFINATYVRHTIGTTTSMISHGLFLSIPLILAVSSGLIALSMAVWFVVSWLSDNSFSIGGYYMHDLPYKGYNRFRSKEWNMEHM
jgi:hypothetical protein